VPMTTATTAKANTSAKFMRSHPAWMHWVRHPYFLRGTLVALILYALFLLPAPGAPAALADKLNLGVFTVLVLAWSALILADGDRPDWLQSIVAFGLVGVMGWLFYRYSGAHWDKLAAAFFDWGRLSGSWWLLLDGLKVTLLIGLISTFLSVLIGAAVGILRTLGSPTLNLFLTAYIDIFRSIPMAVLMVVIFFALPYMGISFGSIATTVVALSIGYGAYASESFRAGFEAIHYGQIEAARALGLSRWQCMRMIMLPQAIPVVIPSLTGILVSMLKDTAVASLVASPELLKRARELYTSKASPTPLVASALIYLVVIIPLTRLANLLEHRMKKVR
jgi:polar amino acid transport system permease protein